MLTRHTYAKVALSQDHSIGHALVLLIVNASVQVETRFYSFHPRAANHGYQHCNPGSPSHRAHRGYSQCCCSASAARVTLAGPSQPAAATPRVDLWPLLADVTLAVEVTVGERRTLDESEAEGSRALCRCRTDLGGSGWHTLSHTHTHTHTTEECLWQRPKTELIWLIWHRIINACLRCCSQLRFAQRGLTLFLSRSLPLSLSWLGAQTKRSPRTRD